MAQWYLQMLSPSYCIHNITAKRKYISNANGEKVVCLISPPITEKKLGESIINLVAQAWWEREGRRVASRRQPFFVHAGMKIQRWKNQHFRDFSSCGIILFWQIGESLEKSRQHIKKQSFFRPFVTFSIQKRRRGGVGKVDSERYKTRRREEKILALLSLLLCVIYLGSPHTNACMGKLPSVNSPML